jgi:hypothetical protein
MTAQLSALKEPVAGAAVEALLTARWEVAELLSRRPSLLAADLLRGHAAELATSALASDQVLSLALETAARDIQAGNPPLDEGALFLFADDGGLASARQSIRGMVTRQQGEPEPAPTDLVAEIERRLADERLTPAELSARLAAEARLQEALWDDPRLPAHTSVRLAMLCSIPRLAERAAELDPNRVPTCQNPKPQAARPRWRPQVETPPVKVSTSGRQRWSPQQTGWLLVGGLFAIALLMSVEPLWRALAGLAGGTGQ